jgi:GNAT superfamily N-acetyltransferase
MLRGETIFGRLLGKAAPLTAGGGVVVARGHIVVRQPGPGDIEMVLQMWAELRAGSGRGGLLAPEGDEAALRRLIAEVAEDPAYRAVVAELDGLVVGMACFGGRPLGRFVEAPVVQIDYLHVRPDYHRRGVGHALVAAATEYCDEVGAEHVVVNVFPQIREANRFYAKIGFSPLVVRRVASAAVLRRKLGLTGSEATARSRRGRLVRRRSAPGRVRTSSII